MGSRGSRGRCKWSAFRSLTQEHSLSMSVPTWVNRCHIYRKVSTCRSMANNWGTAFERNLDLEATSSGISSASHLQLDQRSKSLLPDSHTACICYRILLLNILWYVLSTLITSRRSFLKALQNLASPHFLCRFLFWAVAMSSLYDSPSVLHPVGLWCHQMSVVGTTCSLRIGAALIVINSGKFIMSP